MADYFCFDKRKVVVGISGGVDSAVCAYLLKQQGYDVYGVTMITFDNPDYIEDAKSVCELLDIKFDTVDMRKEFKENIIDNFVSEYLKGRTPNPCTRCNPMVKFESLIRYADSIGAFYIATGHYALIEKCNGRFSVKNSVTALKDQTYALCNLSQSVLERTLMPIGEYDKQFVRKTASDIGLSVANKPDSQDICFVENDYAQYINSIGHSKDLPGNFVDMKGNIIGKHEGITHYTIGQRKGLNLSMGHPVFVVKIDALKNEVVIGESEDLFSDECILKDINYMSKSTDFEDGIELTVKIRYAHKGTAAKVYHVADNRLKVVFIEKVRAITPGQTAVLYDGDFVFAGAVIE